MTASSPALQTSEIQGYILREYSLKYSRYCFLQFQGASQGRRWIERVIPLITTTDQWDPVNFEANPKETVNLALSVSGMKALGVSQASIASFSSEFREGPTKNAIALGDTGEGSPENWEGGFGQSAKADQLHVLLLLCGLQMDDMESLWTKVQNTFQADVKVVLTHDGQFFDDKAEHFGYRDGMGQPDVAGSGNPYYPGRGLPQPDGSWKAISAGEFLFGYPTELGVPNPSPFLEIDGHQQSSINSAYLAYRKLAQHVMEFRQFLSKPAVALRQTDECVAAKLVGRWRDGTPLELSPDKPDPALANDPAKNNDFRYASDKDGMRVPLGSHLRRMNPRDGVAGGNAAVSGHRIIRRGAPYGTRLPEDATTDDDQERGIIFIAVVNSLRDQFEFLQSDWLNSGSFFKLDPAQKDPVSGDNDGTSAYVIPMPGFPRRTPNLSRFVTTRFSSYLFIPSIADLKFLKPGSSE